jgi:HPt (histidine-containing phosphotransfer) domain-containing protein
MPSGGENEWRIELADAMLRSLAIRYLERRRLELETLRGALAAADFEALWIAGHQMHGAGGAFGVMRISELGAALEFSAFDRNVAAIEDRLDELEAFLARVEVV